MSFEDGMVDMFRWPSTFPSRFPNAADPASTDACRFPNLYPDFIEFHLKTFSYSLLKGS